MCVDLRFLCAFTTFVFSKIPAGWTWAFIWLRPCKSTRFAGPVCRKGVTCGRYMGHVSTKCCILSLRSRYFIRFCHGLCCGFPSLSCRICHNSAERDGRLLTFWFIINNTVFQVAEGDGFPHLMCVQCVLQCSRAYTFKQQCERSDNILRNYLSPEFQVNFPDNKAQPIRIDFHYLLFLRI